MNTPLRSLLAITLAWVASGVTEAQSDGTLKWSFTTPGVVYSSPALAADGAIYVGSEDKRLYAINPDGSFKWRYPATFISTADWFDAAPAVGDDGTIYAGNFDGKLYAISSDGELIWTYDTSSYIVSSVAIGSDGTLYVGSGDANLHAVNSDGNGLWTFATGDWVDSSPAIGSDGTIYFGSWDGSIYAVNPDGTEKWSVVTGDAIQSSPAIGPDGTIYIGSGDGALYAVTPGGVVSWSYQTLDSIDASPVVGPDGVVYFGSADGNFYALRPDGSPAWTSPYVAGQGMFGGAVIREDGTLLFGASDRRIYALNANGTLKWSYATGDVIDSTPTIAPDGTIYVGSYDTRLYALHGNGESVIESAWPKFRHDLRNLGGASAVAIPTPPVIVTPPQSQVVPYGSEAAFSVGISGSQPFAFQWLKDGVEIPGATGASMIIAQAVEADEGAYSVQVSNTSGAVTSGLANLAVDPAIPPQVILQPRPLTVVTGDRISLWIEASGSMPLTYQWRRNGLEIDGATSASFEVDAATSGDAGSYDVEILNAGGTVVSDAVNVSVDAAAASRLLNLSTRAFVGTGGSVLIPGLVVSGSDPKRLLIRAVGPTLGTFGVNGTIEDPTLTLFSGSESLLTNDDWQQADNVDEIISESAGAGAFALPDGSHDAAAVVELDPGAYTVQVSGVSGGTGVGLVEVYDLDASAGSASRLVNISTRANVGTGDNVMIPGFVIQGSAARTLVIRAVGPSLSEFGVQDFLADPVLQLHDDQGEILVNDNWTDASDLPALEAAMTAVGAFPLESGSADAAMLVVLAPGSYTAVTVGSGGTTGNVLVEVYEVP